jgi:hypothetical protein
VAAAGSYNGSASSAGQSVSLTGVGAGHLLCLAVGTFNSGTATVSVSDGVNTWH